MSKRNLIMAGVLAVAVVAVVVFGVSQEVQAPRIEGATSTPQGGSASSTRFIVLPARSGPTIATTPYSVYLGFAADFGTSSKELISQEGPQVVVGYEWESLPGSPPFDSVMLPAWDSEGRLYNVYTWDRESRGYVLLGQYPSSADIQFPRDRARGPTRFKVEGVDPALRICPGDRSFNWSARFTLPLEFGVVRTPLTQDLLLIPCRMR